MSEEIWKRIPGVEGYEASSLGRMRSLDREIVTKRGVVKSLKGRIIKVFGNEKDEYLRANLGSKGQSTVHRYVCMAFHDLPPFDGAEVRHLNDDKRDNRPENLAWGNRSENMKDSLRNGTWANQYSKATHCKSGHELLGDNLHIRTNGNRSCRTCVRDTQKRYQDRNRDKVRARWREYAAKKRKLSKEETK